MANLNDAEHYFSEPDDNTLCRGGGNGPINVSQVMPIIKYVKDGQSFLDIGCGSGTTLDVLIAMKKQVNYKGIDFVNHRIEWLKKEYPNYSFAPGDARDTKEPDQSWDIVWSRHVVEHTNSFEGTIDEHCRIARKMVICILFRDLAEEDKEEIGNIKYGDHVYEDEFYNQYNRKKIQDYLAAKTDFRVVEFLEDVSWDGSKSGRGEDTIIVLERI